MAGDFAARPYQLEAIAAVSAAWEAQQPGEPSPMVVMATGTGKTELGLFLAMPFLDAGRRVLWLAHRDDLVTDPIRRLVAARPDLATRCGIVQAGDDDGRADFVCASIPTLGHRGSVDRAGAVVPRGRLAACLDRGAFALVVVDEGHHSAAKTWERLLDALCRSCPGVRLLGLTATPHRADGADLSERWDICYSYDAVRAIGDGWLVPPFVHTAPLSGLDLSRVSSGRTDYDEGDLGRELLRAGVVAHTVDRMTDSEAVTCRRMPEAMHEGVTAEIVPRSRRSLVYTATVEQAELTAAALSEAGIPSRMVCGETPREERRASLAAFVAGSIRCLCSAAVLTEGTNLPPADAIVLARPTRSWSLFVQMCGRGLRLYPATAKADCLVLDLAGASRVHSLIAPPVLVGGAACKDAPDGRHAYRPDAPPKGKCSHCGRPCACLASALDGHPGHVWAPDSTCKYCATPQCSGGPGPHVWLSRIHGTPPKPIRECARCPATTSDPLGGLLGERPEYREARAWIWLPTVPRATGLLLADGLGALVMVPGTVAETWTPWFVPGDASRMRDPRRLAPEFVPTAEARERVAALVTRAPSRDEVNATIGRPREERRELVTLTGDARAVLGLHLTETPWPAAKPARTGAQIKRAAFFRRKNGGRRW